MKTIATFMLLAFSASVFARTPLWRKVEDLEKRVEALEARLNAQKSSTTSNGLKVKDLNEQTIDAGGRGVANAPDLKLTEEQRKEIEEKLQFFQKKQKENQKILDELMNEDL